MIVHKHRVSAAALGALCAAGLLLSACAGNRDRARERLVYQERPVELLFSTGARRLDQRRWDDAIAYFEEVERQHPYSEWSRRAILMTLYAQYQSGEYQDAIAAADRFIQLYPGNQSTPYAFYMRAVAYYEQITDVGRDQAATAQAQAALREVINRYPNTEYAADARLKLDTANDQLAGKEMAVGRYYLRQNQPLAAIGRFKTVIDRYQTTTHTPEALYRLVEAYLAVGLTDEARRNAAVLGHNYAGDQWYADAYGLMTDRGLKPATAPTRRLGIFRRAQNPAGQRTSGDLATPPEATPESVTNPRSEQPRPQPD